MAVDAAVPHFAGSWLTVRDQAQLVAVGSGFSPAGPRFSSISGEECGVDFTAPLRRSPVWQMPRPETAHEDLRKF